jgi:hypothetical protein
MPLFRVTIEDCSGLGQPYDGSGVPTCTGARRLPDGWPHVAGEG